MQDYLDGGSKPWHDEVRFVIDPFGIYSPYFPLPASVMVGDMQRLQHYSDKGFMCVAVVVVISTFRGAAIYRARALMIPNRDSLPHRERTHIPPPVLVAYEKLVKLGFTRHLLAVQGDLQSV